MRASYPPARLVGLACLVHLPDASLSFDRHTRGAVARNLSLQHFASWTTQTQLIRVAALLRSLSAGVELSA